MCFIPQIYWDSAEAYHVRRRRSLVDYIRYLSYGDNILSLPCSVRYKYQNRDSYYVMVFDRNSDLPPHVQRRPVGIQSRWRAIFNSVFNAEMKKGRSRKDAEAAAFRAANSILS